MKIAQYKTEWDTVIVLSAENGGGYTQVSEVIDVKFPPLEPADIQKQEIAAIDKQIVEFQAASQITLNGLERRKAELLALPNTPERVGE